MDLPELCDRADMIFRGKVIDLSTGTVSAGGGEIPTVTYRVLVSEGFKGSFPEAKDGGSVVEITMVSTFKQAPHFDGDAQRVSTLRDLVTLEVGREYLLMTTPPSAAGLCTTVGLTQGAFSIVREEKQEVAVSGAGARYEFTELANQIRTAVEPAQRGEQ
jgi:hypothetical protein